MIFAQNVRLVVNLHGKVASIYFTSAVNVIQLWTESKDLTHLQVYKLFSLHRHPKHRRLVWNTNCLHLRNVQFLPKRKMSKYCKICTMYFRQRATTTSSRYAYFVGSLAWVLWSCYCSVHFFSLVGTFCVLMSCFVRLPPSVWPDMAKFRHFGKIFKVLGKILRVYLVFGKILKLIWQI